MSSAPTIGEMNRITMSSVSKFSLFMPNNESDPTSMNNRNRIMTSAVMTPTRIASRASCGRALSLESLLRKFPRESNREGCIRTVFFGILVNAFEYGAAHKEYKRVLFLMPSEIC